MYMICTNHCNKVMFKALHFNKALNNTVVM